MTKLLVPYNFDFKLIDYIIENRDILNSIEYFYVPCFPGDGDCTRYNLVLDNSIPNNFPTYIEHIRALNTFSNVSILFQNNVNEDIIEKYYNLGIRYFTISNDELGRRLKEKYDDIFLTLSITRLITPSELNILDLSIYDSITLPFNYCRQLYKFDEIPKYNYSLIVNSHCLYNCNRCHEHWTLKKDTLEEFLDSEQVITMNYCMPYSEERAFIKPEDLIYFKNKIKYFKLVDRLDSTNDIIYNIERYSKEYELPARDISWYNLGGE